MIQHSILPSLLESIGKADRGLIVSNSYEVGVPEEIESGPTKSL